MIENLVIIVFGVSVGFLVSKNIVIDPTLISYTFMMILVLIRIGVYILNNEIDKDFKISYTLLFGVISIFLAIGVMYLSKVFGLPFYMLLVVGYSYYIFSDLQNIINTIFFKKNI